ncbi:hypothetical protein CR513_02868, partial [Mucuna pruriens]
MRCHNCRNVGHYARECWAGEGAKNKPNNHAHLAQDEGTDSEAVVLLTITSNEAQPRIPIEEELIATPVFNKASVVRRPLQSRDQELLFQDSTVNLEGELIHSALIAQAEPEKWLKVMKEEINSIEKNQTWELVDPPSNKKPIALKWVYKVKVNPRGEVVKNKAKFVAKGFLQKAGIDYGEFYAPVARIETIMLVVAIAINAGWSMHKLDVKSTFLNGPLEEEAYVNQQLGFVVKGKENKAPRAWNKRIDGYLSQIDFKKYTSEYGVYVKCWKGSLKSEKLLICVYIDDLLITGSSEGEIASFKKQMMNEFEMSGLGLLSYFLGIEFETTRYVMVMHQTKYAKDLLKRFNMQQSNPVGTPVGLNLKKEIDEEQVDPTHYRRIVHARAKALSLISCKENIEVCAGDDWCRDKQDRKSTAWYIFFYGGAPISLSSTKEPVAEYIVAFETACQAIWLDALLGELQEKNSKKKVNKASSISWEEQTYRKSKHIETRFHFLKEQVSNEKLQIEHCRTEIQFANIFINALKRERFRCLRVSIGIEFFPVQHGSVSSQKETRDSTMQHSQEKDIGKLQSAASSGATDSNMQAFSSAEFMDRDLEAMQSEHMSSVPNAPLLVKEGDAEPPPLQTSNELNFDGAVANDSESDDNDLYLSECRILLVGFDVCEMRKLVNMVRKGGGSREKKDVRSLAALGVIYVVKTSWLEDCDREKKEVPVLRRHIAYDIFHPKASLVKGAATSSMPMEHSKSTSFHQNSQNGHVDFEIVKPEYLEKRKEEKTDMGINGHSFSKAIGRTMLQNQLPNSKLRAQRMTQHDSIVQYAKSANVFRGKLFCFSNLFPEERRAEIVQWISQGGGEIISGQTKQSVHYTIECHGVTPVLTGDSKCLYISSHWIRSCLEAGSLLDVDSHILYSPLPCCVPLPGFESFRLCVSQYEEKDRILLRNLCFVLGAKLVEKLTKKVTHLLCKFTNGPKYEAACKWGIKSVTSEWIFECVKQLFDNWRVKMPTIFGFQDVIEVVTIGFAEPGRNAIEEQRLILLSQFLIYQCVTKIFNKISNASTSKEAWKILVKTYGDGEKNKKVKLQTLRRQYELLNMEEKESVANYFDGIQELVNAMRICKEKVTDQQVVDKILRTLPPEFDYIAATIKESKDLDTMEVEELQHSLEALEMRINKKRSI